MRKSMSVSFWMTPELIVAAREVSKATGVPVSRLVRDGLARQVERYQAMSVLIEKTAELREHGEPFSEK